MSEPLFEQRRNTLRSFGRVIPSTGSKKSNKLGVKCTRAALWPQFPLSLIRRSGVILKMLTGIWIGLGMPIGLPLVGGLARLLQMVGILAGLACLVVIMYLYLGHSYAFHRNGLSRGDSVLLCRIAANERLYREGCQD
jgi:hypothetical protein